MNAEKIICTATLIDEGTTWTLTEICKITRTQPDLILQLVEYQIIQPIGDSQLRWQFDEVAFKKVKLARNFYHDLEVNMQGIALLLDMLDEIDQLKSEIAKLK